MFFLSLGDPEFGRVLAGGIHDFACGVEPVASAQHRRELPFPKRPIQRLAPVPAAPEWTKPALSRQCERGAAFLRLVRANLFSSFRVDPGLPQCLPDPPRTVSAPQQAART